MPTPPNERRALEQERAELPAETAAYQIDLAATPAENKTRREMLEWQFQRDQKRMVEVDRRLGGFSGRKPEAYRSFLK